MNRKVLIGLIVVGGLVVCAVCGVVMLVVGGGDDEESQPVAQEQTVPTVTVVEAVGEVVATNTPLPPPPTFTPTVEPTPIPVGLSRSNPLSRAEITVVPNWEVQVLETIRGEAAWQAIQVANQFNEPPKEGMEYLLVRLRVKSTHDDSEEHPISGADFKVTGDRLIEYFTASVVEPDPILDARLFSGGEAEGWSAYMIAQGEGNLILIVDELLDFSIDNARFITLDEGAAINVPPELAGIQATESGIDRNTPVSRNETIVTEDWEVSVLEVVRGEAAWQMVQEVNQFNEPPEEGLEYIAVKVGVHYIGTQDEAKQIDASYFQTTGEANVVYELPSVVDPEPALDVSLFPGGRYEGWITVQAAVGEAGVRLIFEPLLEFSDRNKRFISLQ